MGMVILLANQIAAFLLSLCPYLSLVLGFSVSLVFFFIFFGLFKLLVLTFLAKMKSKPSEIKVNGRLSR